MSASDKALENFREEVRDWLEDNHPPSLRGLGLKMIGGGEGAAPLTADAVEWRRRLGARGWGTPGWPAEYGGGGLDHRQQRVLEQELQRAEAFNPIPYTSGMGVTMVGPTILEYGTEEQKKRHIPPICRGEVRWCLGYSEPNAGSDLASLTTRAEDRGDHWLINGQKTWTSCADVSHWCGALVRTDPKAAKRDGISFLMLQMDQPGVETRKIALIAGESPFCEVFLTDAVAAKDDLLGPLNGGWAVGKRLLQHERASQTGSLEMDTGPRVSIADLARQYAGTDEAGRLADGDLRSRLARHLMDSQAHKLTLERIVEEARGKAEVNATASILKNSATVVAQGRSELMLEILGQQGLGWTGDAFTEAELATVRGWLFGKAMSIYGGSFEIQKNIISKNILGLPEMTQRG